MHIGGKELPRGTPLRSYLKAEAKKFQRRELTLKFPDGHIEQHSFGELGVSLDVASIERRASAIGRRGSIAVRIRDLLRSSRGAINIPWSFALDPGPLTRRLLKAKANFDSHPKPARFRFSDQSILPHRSGRYLALDDALDSLRQAPIGNLKSITISAREVHPEITSQRLQTLDMNTVVATYQTRFGRGGDANNRATNIEVAARQLDGLVLVPDELISFNRVVGARTKKNGFRPSWEIYKGEMVRGIGGGTCQVSSTLHAAALYAGLDILERFPHSRPSAYIGLGLDSTVAWPSIDLKLKNPWDFPIVIRATVQGIVLKVELLGARRPAKIKFHRETLSILPFKRKVTESTWVAEGRAIKKQKGIDGYRIRRTREITPIAGKARKETTIDFYPPTPEHFIVHPDTNLDDVLPPDPSATEDSASNSAENTEDPPEIVR